MEESFEYRSLLDRDALRTLQTRKDLPSVIHLGLQVGAFLACIALLVYVSSFPLAAFVTALALGAVWTTFFAPFHESAHQTAFRTRRLNSIAGWITGIPFGMGLTVYREFHFEHHRYTHIPDKDPELAGNATFGQWPITPSAWAYMVAGLWLLWLKVRLMFRLAVSSAAHAELPPPFADPDLRVRVERAAAAGSARGAGRRMDSLRAAAVPCAAGDLADGGAHGAAARSNDSPSHAHDLHLRIRQLVVVEHELPRRASCVACGSMACAAGAQRSGQESSPARILGLLEPADGRAARAGAARRRTRNFGGKVGADPRCAAIRRRIGANAPNHWRS
jgi:Fatty acid desaturase